MTTMCESKKEGVDSRSGFSNSDYHLPVSILHELGCTLGDVISSAKLSHGLLDVNRYYVRIIDFGDFVPVDALSLLAEKLRLPSEGLVRAKAELERFGKILFAGAGASIDGMAYRLYFGFGVNQNSEGPTGSSIDWRPGTSKFIVKNYTEHGNVTRQTELDLLKTCLSTVPGTLSGVQLHTYEQCAEITRGVAGALHVTQIQEANSSRHSVAFNFYWASRTSLQDILFQLEKIADALLVQKPALSAWIDESKGLRIIDVAAGLDGDNETFVTIYLGETKEPPELRDFNQPEQVVPSGRNLDSLLPDLNVLHLQSHGDPSILVAVIDGPVDLRHPCLADASIEISGSERINVHGQGEATDHATGVASLIFGGLNTDVVGISPGCSGLVIPVFPNEEDETSGGCSQAELSSALLLAAKRNASVINISGGQLLGLENIDPDLLAAVNHCIEKDILIVAAAGNEGCHCDHVPAALSGILVVGGMTKQGDPSLLSNVSQTYHSRGIVAPSENVLVAKAGGGLVSSSGTSYAAALVSGTSALLSSVLNVQGIKHSMRDIFHALIDSASDCTDRQANDCYRLLSGRLSLMNAYQLLLNRKGKAMDTIVEETQSIEKSGSGEAPCKCNTKEPAVVPEKVYAIGGISFEYASRSRRDSFQQAGLENPDDRDLLLEFLNENPSHSPAVTWLLVQEDIPIYAIQPSGAFSKEVFMALCDLLGQQSTNDIERVSIPGIITGSATLSDGSIVPALWPDIRGIYGWATPELASQVQASQASGGAKKSEQVSSELNNFLDRVYYEFRNPGQLASDRALNYAATNALQAGDVFGSALRDGLSLESIAVEKSAISRPGSEIYEVKLKFFNHQKLIEQAKVVFRYMVDVSDIIPVTIGNKRRWHVS